MLYPLDNYWAMEPRALETLRRNLESGSGDPQITQKDRLELLALSAEDAEDDGLPLTVKAGVAMIHLDGPMIKRGGWMARWFGMTSTLAVRRAVEVAVADAEVGAILLRIDSPGGSVDGLAELGDAVYEARQRKTVIAQVDGLAASAGYYVASQATAVYAQRMDLIGSIGTRLMLYDFHEQFAKEGIEAVPIDSAPKDRPYKSAGAMGTEITKLQRAEFQRIVDDFFDDFRAVIVRGRGMSDAQVRELADGRVWVAAEALALGLIDRVQTLEETLVELQQAAAANAAGRSRLSRARAELMGRDGSGNLKVKN